MRLHLKAAGTIGHHLPSTGHIDVADGMTIAALIAYLKLPDDRGYLVSVNNEMVSPTRYGQHALRAGDEIMLMPPLKGG